MKTNREAFMEELQNADTNRLVELTTGYGRCHRCSNYFWDGNQGECHKNINESSCEKGMAEWFDANVGENLQIKYKKKSWKFHNYTQASYARMLADLLYSCGLVEKTDNKCNYCRKKECVMSTICSSSWINIRNMASNYAKSLTKDLDPRYEEYTINNIRRKYEDEFVFIEEVLLPKIEDLEVRGQAKMLVKLINDMWKQD